MPTVLSAGTIDPALCDSLHSQADGRQSHHVRPLTAKHLAIRLAKSAYRSVTFSGRIVDNRELRHKLF